MPRSAPTCKDCPERHTACHDQCGRFAAWKAEVQKADAARREYLIRSREDFLRSEDCHSLKHRYKEGKNNGPQ